MPTTKESAASPNLTPPAVPRSSTSGTTRRRASARFSPRAGYADLADKFMSQWQAGKITDLHAALVKLDSDIKNQLQQEVP